MGVLYQEEDRNWKKNKSGQIPAFGNWDYANDLPITQYFESARQAGLIRASYSSAADSGEYCDANYQHLYTLRRSNYRPPPPKAKVQLAKEHGRQSLKKENKADYLTEQPRQSKLTNKDNRGGGATRVPPGKQKQKTTNIINVRAVDEDLYKIPPELLHSSKRKKRLGFFSCCLVPACMV